MDELPRELDEAALIEGCSPPLAWRRGSSCPSWARASAPPRSSRSSSWVGDVGSAVDAPGIGWHVRAAPV